MSDILKGRKALITGGSRGFGAGIAKAFVDAGAKVVLADVLEHALDQLGGRDHTS